MMKHFSTILVVTLVTALVWMFAESATLQTRELVAEIALDPDPTGERVATLGGGERSRLVLVVEGSPAALERAERLLRRPLRFSTAEIPSQPGSHVVDAERLVRAHPEFRPLGATIKSCEPGTLEALIDGLTTRDASVRVDVARGELDGQPEIKPARVRLRFPSRRAADVGDAPVVTALVDEAQSARLVPGRRETIPGVRLSPPKPLAGESHVSISPPLAEVQLAVRGLTSTLTLPSVPVHLQLAPGEQAKWDITLDPKDEFLTDVTVTGPSELIRQIREKTLSVVGVLSLSYEDLESGRVTSKDVSFSSLPTSLRFECADRSVSFTIRRRGG